MTTNAPRLRRFCHLLVLLLLLGDRVAHAALDFDSGYLDDYEAASSAYDQREFGDAIVHLKNALQKNPGHLPSRLLLGQAQLKVGRAPEAEKELLIALRRGAAKDRVLIPLGNALLLQRKYEDILDRITLDGLGRAGSYEALTLRGRAYRELGQLEDAHASFDAALAINDQFMEAYLAKSRTFSAGGDIAQAEQWVNRALDSAPESPEVMYEKANLRRRQGDAAAAMDFYNRAINAGPNHMRARLGRASLSLALGELEQAGEDAQFVHTRVPFDPDASFLYAQILAATGDQAQAKEVLGRTADGLSMLEEKEILRQPGLVRVAALISLQQGMFDRANYYLDHYVEKVPHEVRMRLISAKLKLELGDTAGAVQVLEPVYRAGNDDPALLSILGDAYLLLGRYYEAQLVLEKAAAQEPDASHLRTRLALSRFGNDDPENAWADLERANAEPETGSLAGGVILAVMLARSGDYEEASSLAEKLEEAHPDNPVVHNLVGIVALNRNDLAAAETSFQRAVALDPSFVPALYNLGLMAVEARDIDSAESRFDNILELDPSQPHALSASAELRVAQGDLPGAIGLLYKAIVSPSADSPMYTRLIELLLLEGDASQAREVGISLANREKDNPEVLTLQAHIELAAGNREKAVTYLRRASQLASEDGVLQLRIAHELIRLGEHQSAKTAMVLALATDQRMEARDQLVQFFLRQGDIEAATREIKQAQREAPGSTEVAIMEARMQQHEGNVEQALESYREALAKSPDREILLEVVGLYDALNMRDAGFDLLEEWLDEHPDDTIVQRVLALGYLRDGRRDDARELLEQLAETRDTDSLVLASLAQIYQQEGNPEARGVAERALRLSPNWAIALDTYGWILVQENELEEGLKYLREANSRDSNPLIRYHLAAALYNLGRFSEASTHLEVILRLEPEPSWIESARELYQSIKRREAAAA